MQPAQRDEMIVRAPSLAAREAFRDESLSQRKKLLIISISGQPFHTEGFIDCGVASYFM